MEASSPVATSAPTPSTTETSAPVANTAPVATPSVDTGSEQPTEIPKIGQSSEVLLSADPSSILETQEAPTPATDSPSGLIPEVTDANKSWLDKFEVSEELRDNPNISKYKTLDDALKANVNLVKKLGEKGIMRPDENADAETWSAWYDHIGRPTDPDGYSDYEPPKMTDAEGNEISQFEIDKDVYKEAKSVFHEAGLTDSQAQKVMELYANTSIGQMDQEVKYSNEQATQTRAQLQKEWGAEMGAKVKTVQNVANKLGIMDTLVENGLANNYSMIKMLDTLSEKIGESKLTGDVSAHGGGFEATLKQIQSHPAYHDKSHPDYHTLQKRRIDLYARKHNV